ncbi:hypothetical protein [Trichocoleus sp. FACHB-591]|nr:hypothetical protein [Trichocoleus sp. FACHB-591]
MAQLAAQLSGGWRSHLTKPKEESDRPNSFRGWYQLILWVY